MTLLRRVSLFSLRNAQRRGGGGGGSFWSEGTKQPEGYLFNETPLPPGQKRRWESWEMPWYVLACCEYNCENTQKTYDDDNNTQVPCYGWGCIGADIGSCLSTQHQPHKLGKGGGTQGACSRKAMM